MPKNVLVLLVTSFVFVDCGVLSGKGVFCRDPDSGKLYGVNSTWSSESFCGNYTCKIRKRNLTQYGTPIRHFNVTIDDNEADKNLTVTIQKKDQPDILSIVHKNRFSNPKNMLWMDMKNSQTNSKVNVPNKRFENNQKYKPKSHNCLMDGKHIETSDENERYLTEREIDNIAELLHTVKKSDLDAVVEMYNLAQEIYKELDKATDKEIVNEAMHLLKEEKFRNKFRKPNPHRYNTIENNNKIGFRHDMDIQSTNKVKSTSMKPKLDADTFFNGLSNSNVKLPYYYPMTKFQRSSSYTHTPSKTTKTNKIDDNTDRNDVTQTGRQNAMRHRNLEQKPFQKLSHPSLLPYPFTHIQYYKLDDSNSLYNSKTPWTVGYYNGYRYYQPYYNEYVPRIHKAVLVNPHLSYDVLDLGQKPVKVVNNDDVLEDIQDKNKLTPDWKTQPISMEVLRDIKANIDSSKLIKALPLRKSIKLERVGKRGNSEEKRRELIRRRRSVDERTAEQKSFGDKREYETYLEKVKCQERIEPGYFKIGNMSQPYPNCCPQMIDKL